MNNTAVNTVTTYYWHMLYNYFLIFNFVVKKKSILEFLSILLFIIMYLIWNYIYGINIRNGNYF